MLTPVADSARLQAPGAGQPTLLPCSRCVWHVEVCGWAVVYPSVQVSGVQCYEAVVVGDVAVSVARTSWSDSPDAPVTIVT